MLTPQELAREIGAGKFRPAYYLFGADNHRIVEAEKYIAAQFLPDRQLSTNYRRINARGTPINDLLTELSTIPMLGERQVFGISEFQNCKPTQVANVLKMLTPADPNRIVVFSSPSVRTPKKTSAFFKAVSNAVTPVECRKLTEREAAAIIRHRLEKAELEISTDAAKRLVELVAGSMGALATEVAKLTCYKQKDETIDIADIEKITAGHDVYSIFQLSDEIIAGNENRVLRTIKKLVEEGNSPGAMISLLQRHFLSLYLVKNNKAPIGNLRWMTQRFRTQAERYGSKQLEEIIKNLAQAASDVRGGTIKPTMVLEMLVLGMLGQRQPIGK